MKHNSKKEKVISYITEEIRSLELAPKINGCPMTPEWAAQLDIMRTCLEAVQLSDFAEVSKQAEREYYAGFSSNPAQIDRDAWEPCGNCQPSCGNCISGCEYEDEDDCPLECQCCVNHNNYRPKDKYCSACGRPLTEKARAELEKRLRGTNP